MPNTRQELHRHQQQVPVQSDDRSLAARIIEAQNLERRKISRELYDGVANLSSRRR